jgi:hypothetical protein
MGVTADLSALTPDIEAFFEKMGGWPCRVKISTGGQPKLTVTACFEDRPLREYIDQKERRAQGDSQA